MKKVVIAVVVLLALILIPFMWAKGVYNGLVLAQETVSQTWGDVQSAYQRRLDLIPNLVETVKGYAAHEKDVLVGVTEARSKVSQMKIDPQAMTPEALKQFQGAQTELSGALSRLMVVVERYPDLKANQNFMDLQSQLEGTENRINVARTRFNDAAKAYNTKARVFPDNLIANMFGFLPKPYFEAQAGADVAPKVKF